MSNAPIDDVGGAHIVIDFVGDDLESSSLLKLIPLRPLRPKRKGEPMGRALAGKTPVAKTGYCGFSTGSSDIDSTSAEDHAQYCLDVIEPILSKIRNIVISQKVRFEVMLLEGTRPGEFFSDIPNDVLKKFKTLQIPISPEPHYSFRAQDPALGKS